MIGIEQNKTIKTDYNLQKLNITKSSFYLSTRFLFFIVFRFFIEEYKNKIPNYTFFSDWGNFSIITLYILLQFLFNGLYKNLRTANLVIFNLISFFLELLIILNCVYSRVLLMTSLSVSILYILTGFTILFTEKFYISINIAFLMLVSSLSSGYWYMMYYQEIKDETIGPFQINILLGLYCYYLWSLLIFTDLKNS